jgi:ferredoxin-NADP reductase
MHVDTFTRPLRQALRHPWVAAIVRESAVEDTLRALHPLLSLSQVRARVVKVIQETADTRTLVLRPNRLWRGAQAGQFVGVTVEIAGRRHERMYSLTSRPGSRLLAITVKRQGLVSGHLHEQARVGAVLTLSPAMGDFVLPAELPPRLLLLSAGSGITPVMALLRELQARRYTGDVAFVHGCRNPAALIFARELQALTGLRLVLHFSETAGRLDMAALQAAVPDLAERATWVCGPTGLMDAVQALWQAGSFTAPLHAERFAAAPLAAQPLSAPVRVQLTRSQRGFESLGAAPLLLQAEGAGLAPKHGCRIGICSSCQCVKRSGTVQNLHTGELSSAPDEVIRLCISAARSDLSLDL